MTNLDKYKDHFVVDPYQAYGKCKETVEQMATVFQELRIVRGHYYCSVWGQREHWWLETIDGIVIDPTAAQFPSKGTGEYIEWIGEEPTGQCPNCGEYCYNNNYCCSERCHSLYVAYCTNPGSY